MNTTSKRYTVLDTNRPEWLGEKRNGKRWLVWDTQKQAIEWFKPTKKQAEEECEQENKFETQRIQVIEERIAGKRPMVRRGHLELYMGCAS